MIAAAVGGATAGWFNDWSGASTNTAVVNGKTITNLNTWSGIGSFAANQGMQNLTSAALSQALGQGGSVGDALKNSLYNTFAAAGFNQVGNFGGLNNLAPGSAEMVAMHAVMGGVASVISGGDFATGAAAAGANEALVANLNSAFSAMSPEAREQMLTTSSQLIGLLAVAATNPDASASQLETGAWVAKNSMQYNFLNHQDVEDLQKALVACQPKGNCDEVREEFRRRDSANSARLAACTTDCAAIRNELDAGSQALKTLWESDSTGITDEFMRNNINEWSSAGPRVASQVGEAAWSGDSTALTQLGQYLDQQGFNPFGINPAGLIGFGGTTGSSETTAGSIRSFGEEIASKVEARLPEAAVQIDASSSEAGSINSQAALRAKLSGLQKAQQTAAITKTLPDGRVRYYTQEVPARTEGATRGASFVTEYDPSTGATRQWMESYDQLGAVIRVHPKSINGQPVSAQHYPPTGAELESWK